MDLTIANGVKTVNLKGEWLHNYIDQSLLAMGLNHTQSNFINGAIDLLIIFLLALIADWVSKKIIIQIIKHFVEKSKTDWDDIIYEQGVFNKLSHMAPALVVNALIEMPLTEFPRLVSFIKLITSVWIVIVITMVIIALTKALHDIYKTTEMSKRRSIKGYIQMVHIIIYSISALIILSILMHKNIGYFVTGLGAMAAVLMLVFKDTILGLVGSIQLSANDMVRIGDWIEMSKYGADGSVIEMNLTTIKVRNANNTITTLPTYAMVSDSFINWRGMSESEGRRIKRSLYIDIKSIRFCTAEMINTFSQISILKEFIESDAFQSKKDSYTNTGIFRAYIESYIRSVPEINNELTILARQMQPGEHGLPIEIYCFSKVKDFEGYEKLQSSIIEHLVAITPIFSLSLFQSPSGDDFRTKPLA
jgi:miniconductance mechanosensitive channel